MSIRGQQSRADHIAGRAPQHRLDWRRPYRNLSTSLIDIDVALTDIVFERRGNDFNEFGARRPTSIADCALEGVVRRAPEEGDEKAAEPVRVFVSGYDQSDRLDRGEDIDQRSVCYIANDRRPERAWRTNIYIEGAIFRRLVELFASKRIDFARISILVTVLRDPSGRLDVPHLRRPMLRTASDPRFQHSRAHIMSVQTALGVSPGVGASWAPRSREAQAS